MKKKKKKQRLNRKKPAERWYQIVLNFITFACELCSEQFFFPIFCYFANGLFLFLFNQTITNLALDLWIQFGGRKRFSIDFCLFFGVWPLVQILVELLWLIFEDVL